jgi:hypothetical protein
LHESSQLAAKQRAQQNKKSEEKETGIRRIYRRFREWPNLNKLL